MLRWIFGENVVTFEHFGSAAVPGLPAKPVIDMMCIVQSIEQIDACNGEWRRSDMTWQANGVFPADACFGRAETIGPIISMCMESGVCRSPGIWSSETT